MNYSNLLTAVSSIFVSAPETLLIDNLPVVNHKHNGWDCMIVSAGEGQFTAVLSPAFLPAVFFTYGLLDSEADSIKSAKQFIDSGEFASRMGSSTVFYRVTYHDGSKFYETISDQGYSVKATRACKPYKNGRYAVAA